MATRKRGKKADWIAEALGASRVVPLGHRFGGGPLDWLMLAQIVQSRFVSRGGRPSDPHWDMRRLVPFRRQIWKRLAREAETISAAGRRVGPAQLAAIVIEETLASTESSILQGQTWFLPSQGSDLMWKVSNVGCTDVQIVISSEIKEIQPYLGGQPVG